MVSTRCEAAVRAAAGQQINLVWLGQHLHSYVGPRRYCSWSVHTQKYCESLWTLDNGVITAQTTCIINNITYTVNVSWLILICIKPCGNTYACCLIFPPLFCIENVCTKNIFSLSRNIRVWNTSHPNGFQDNMTALHFVLLNFLNSDRYALSLTEHFILCKCTCPKSPISACGMLKRLKEVLPIKTLLPWNSIEFAGRLPICEFECVAFAFTESAKN